MKKISLVLLSMAAVLGLLLPVNAVAQDGGPERVVLLDFTVNMNPFIDAGMFNPDTYRLYKTGSFSGWSTSETALAGFQLLEDQVNPGFYNLLTSAQIPEGDYMLRSKFIFFNEADQITWEQGDDREYFVAAADTVVAPGEILDFNLPVVINPIPFTISFTVDMSFAAGDGLFQPALNDVVEVRGSFNDWSGGDVMTFVEDSDYLYTTTLSVMAPADAVLEYKYFIDTGDDRTITNDGWEEFGPDIDPFTNRQIFLSEFDPEFEISMFDTFGEIYEDDFDNIILNSDFATGDLTHWSLFVADWEGVQASADVVNGEAVISGISGAGGAVWHVQLNQIFTQEQIDMLNVGSEYGIAFAAKSNVANRPLRMFFGEDGGGFQDQHIFDVNLTTDMDFYETYFVLTAVYPGMKLGFEAGLSNDDVIISEVYLVEIEGMPEVTPLNLPVTFNDTSIDYGLLDFGGAESAITSHIDNPGNRFVMTVKQLGAEPWAGTTIGGTTGFETAIPFDSENTTMSVDIWSPAIGIPVLLKVENAGNPQISVETISMTTTRNQWETMVFDFANHLEGTQPLDVNNDYNKASIFFNFGTNGNGDTYFWDNVAFGGEPGVIIGDVRDISFTVNVTQAMQEGYFQPQRGDQVFVRGGFNGWDASFPMVNIGNDNFVQIWEVFGAVGDTIQYKYFINTGDDRDIPNGGWELFLDPETGEPDAFLNRYIVLAESNMTVNDDFTIVSDTIIDPTEYLPIYLIPSQSGVAQGEQFHIDVLVGSPEIQAVNLYGVGMTLVYDSDAFMFESIERGEMLDGLDNVLLEFVDATSSHIEIFFSFTLSDDELSLPSFGQLARVNFKTRDDATPDLYTMFTNDEEAIDNNGAFFDVMGDFAFIFVLGDGMYPGDTNRDGIVDAFDIDALSTWFLEMGPPRPFRSIVWAPQDYFTWEEEDATFADTNGDGIVNQNDLLPIGLNFGKTTPDFEATMAKRVQTESPVAFTLPAMQNGYMVRYQVTLGSEINPMESVRSIALNLGFDSSLLKLTGVETSAWADGGSLLQFNRFDENRQLHSLSVARTDGIGLADGEVLTLTFEAMTQLAEGTEVTLERGQVGHETGLYFYPRFQFSPIGVTSTGWQELPVELSLNQNYPNPFNPTTTIRFSIPSEQHVTLVVYNVMGQRIATLADGLMAGGQHSINFNATGLSSGMYVYRLITPMGSQSRTMMFIK